jgi:hypothetical protein
VSLSDWERSGWLLPHRTSPREIADLLGVVERDLADSQTAGLSTDWRLNIAYNAALQAATAALAASGYRASRDQHHYRVIQSLELTIGAERKVVSPGCVPTRVVIPSEARDLRGRSTRDAGARTEHRPRRSSLADRDARRPLEPRGLTTFFVEDQPLSRTYRRRWVFTRRDVICRARRLRARRLVQVRGLRVPRALLDPRRRVA